jgi:TonB-linked SusC/RagA family outer membrane protein
MKITTLLLLLGLLQVSARSYGQRVTLHERNASLESVLKKIRAQSGYDVLFDLSLVQRAKAVSVDVQEVSVEDALHSSLAGQALSFSIDNKTIVIREQNRVEQVKEFFRAPVAVRCVVTDSTGNALPGATLNVKGTKKYFVTDNKGEVLLPEVPDGGLALIVSYVGYDTRELYVHSFTKSPFAIILRQSANQLNEVTVVDNGYNKTTRERASGAYATISSEEIAKTPTVNILDRLEGKLPGVKIDTRSNSIQIRGVSNFNGIGSGPLIVVDGFPLIQGSSTDAQARLTNTNGPLTANAVISRFDPQDIEQITVLKDAAATAIWGAGAANGVIVIETKKGKRGQAPLLNFSYNMTITQRPDLAGLRLMNSAQYINLEQELVDKNYLPDPAATTGPNALYVANNSDATEWMYRVKRGTATPAERDAALAELATHNSLDQINQHLLQNGVTHQATMSLSGGSDHSTYSFAANYTKDQPFYRNNYGESIILNTNLSSDFFKRRLTLRVGLNYQLARTQYNEAAGNALASNATSLRPYDLLLDANGNRIQRTVLFRQSIADGLTAQGYLPFGYNALNELNYSSPVGITNSIRIIGGLNGKITNWLNADVSFAAQRQFGTSTTLHDINGYTSRILVNTGTSVVNGKLVYGVPYGGTYYQAVQSSYDTDARGQLNANFLWDEGTQLTALAGVEVRENGAELSASTRYGFNSDVNSSQTFNPTVPYMTMYGYTQTLGDNLTSISLSRKRFFSYYSNAAYSFRNRYAITGSVRFDDYTLLGVDRDNRATPFWSGGLRWNAARENFLSSVSWLTDLALRTSIGTSGSVPLTGNVIPLLTVGGVDFRTQQPIAAINTPANRGLTWERNRQVNFGIDFSLFKGRLFGNADVYEKRSTNIIYQLPYNATYGWSTLAFNTASLTGRGYEFGITGQVVNRQRFKWNSTLNLSYNTNRVTDSRFANNANNLVTSGQPLDGLPLGALFVYRWAGLDNKGQSQIYDRNDGVISNTTNLTSAFTRDDLKYAGTTVAPYSGGFFNNFSYGPFTVSAQITYYFGNVFLKQSVNSTNYPAFQGQFYGVLGRMEDLDKRWRQPGDEATTNVPGLANINNNSITRYQFSDLLVRKGDNVRLQQISLAYTVPGHLLPRAVFKDVSVSANMRNIGILWRANGDGIDPLYYNTGRYAQLAPAPSYVFGINASF